MVGAHAQGEAEIATRQLALVVCQILCSQHSESRSLTPGKTLLNKLHQLETKKNR
jgi:predicted metal-binding protein